MGNNAGKIIVICSGKGGAGKSTLSSAIGVSFASRGKRVLILDWDFGLRTQDLIFGVESSVLYDLGDVLDGRCRFTDALIHIREMGELYIIAAPLTTSYYGFSREKIKELTDTLSEKFDYILIDAPAGIDQGLVSAAAVSDCAIVVCLPESTALRSAQRAGAQVKLAGVPDIFLVINRVVPEYTEKGYSYNVDEIMDYTGIRLLGIVPEDLRVSRCINRGRPINVKFSQGAAKAIGNIAARIDGQRVPLYNLKKTPSKYKK